ncbi:NAD(P)/FAD-dependent oxidoreductase [Noviherbaspirillum sp.]|uniref:NAD(P)/FAD-dependent oxidoreductase n=1 Tax=Noviherbaspirillum sp. TaxID=1926288 RepID=UPI002FE0AB49
MLSFWEQDAMLAADLIVIGGGLIGLQTALEYRSRRPHESIKVLERGLLPSGASSRNAGFACFGSLTEIIHDIDAIGLDATLLLVQRRREGLARMRRRLGDDAIAYEHAGGFELLTDAGLAALERLDEVNRALHPLFGAEVFSVDDAGLKASGFGPRARVLIRNPFEGQLHAGKMMRALAKLAGEQCIEIHTGIDVGGLEPGHGTVHVRTRSGMAFEAARVAICTNALAADLLPDSGIAPGRGQVLLTEPVPGLPWRGAHHIDQGFYYFRNVGDRVLLGGGRHLDFAGEATGELVTTAAIQSALERLLHEVILPGRNACITHRWAGIMGFSTGKQPIVRRIGQGMVLGFGCNGMGVALGADIAAETAGLLLQ